MNRFCGELPNYPWLTHPKHYLCPQTSPMLLNSPLTPAKKLMSYVPEPPKNSWNYPLPFGITLTGARAVP